MADMYETFGMKVLINGQYRPFLAIKGDKGDPGPVASEEEIRRVTSEEVAKVVAEAPEDFDTLKEISDWIATHADDASAMNSAIQANAQNIATNTANISTAQGTANSALTKANKALEIVSFNAETGELVTRTMT